VKRKKIKNNKVINITVVPINHQIKNKMGNHIIKIIKFIKAEKKIIKYQWKEVVVLDNLDNKH
jgi:hypothetical protein